MEVSGTLNGTVLLLWLLLMSSAAEVTSNGAVVMRMEDAAREVDRLFQGKRYDLSHQLLDCLVIGFVDAGVLVMMIDDAASEGDHFVAKRRI
jgi:hypothetical protein